MELDYWRMEGDREVTTLGIHLAISVHHHHHHHHQEMAPDNVVARHMPQLPACWFEDREFSE
jgi:hypothetical protein